MKFDVAVIILNYNSSEYTIQCIESVIQYTSPEIKHEIIIVDNNSLEEEINKLKNLAKFSQVKMIRSKVNLGFSQGHMFGLQFTNANYYVFLNNDCIFLNDCISILMDFCKKNPNTAICTGQMYDTFKKHHHSFNYFPTLSVKILGSGILRLVNPQRFPSLHKQYNEPIKVDFVTGSFLFVRAEYFATVGGFDTNYFLYCEEEDMAMRMKKIKKDVYLVPAAKFMHLGGESTKRDLQIAKEYYISLFYFYGKYFSFWKRMALRAYYFLKVLKKVYKDSTNAKLAWFILRGASMKESLRFRQKMNPNISCQESLNMSYLNHDAEIQENTSPNNT